MLQNAVAYALYVSNMGVAYHKTGSVHAIFCAQYTKFGHGLACNLVLRRLCHSKMGSMHESLYLIIGVGNTLRRDDGAGIELAEAVAGALAAQGRVVEIRLLQQLLPELAEEICDIKAQTVLITDCSAECNEAQEGWLQRLLPVEDGRRGRLRSEGGEGHAGMGSHGLGATALIEVARRLYGFEGEAWLATVPGVDFEHGEGLSTASQHAIDHLTPTIVDLIS